MDPRRKILVLSDNPFLLGNFIRIVQTLGGEDRLACFYSAGSESLFNGFPSSIPMRALRLRSEWENMKEDYVLAFSIHCKQMFPENMVKEIPCINLHPGLNPYNRGWYPQVFAILNGLPHGATLHVMDEQLDHGPIIDQQAVSICEWDTSRDVYERVQQAEIMLLEKNLPSILQGKISAFPAKGEGNVNLKADFRSLCKLDLDQTMKLRDAIKMLRALTHPPYKNAFYYTSEGKKVYVNLELKLDNTI